MSVYDQDYGSGGGVWLKIKAGDKVRLRMVQDPVPCYKEFDGQVVPGKVEFLSVVLHRNEEDNTSEMKYWRMPISVFNAIKGFVKDADWGNPVGEESGFDIRVTRTGAGINDTKYQAIALPKKPLSAADRAMIAEKIGSFPIDSSRFPVIEGDGVMAPPPQAKKPSAADLPKDHPDYDPFAGE